MSENNPSAGASAEPSEVRVMSIRITDDLRAKLELIAQLNGRKVTEEIRLALEAWVDASKSDPKVLERVETARAEIERKARADQSAFEAIFGNGAKAPRGRGSAS